MENILAITLLAFIAILFSLVAVRNLFYQRRRGKESPPPLEHLELIKKQGIITEEEYESLKDGAARLQESSIESCIISAEEIMEAVDAALKPVDELERTRDYTGSANWAEVFGIQSPLNLSLKEATLLSMKVVKPREAVDLIAEVLSMNVPIDALEAVQNRGKSAFPNYRAIARMIWVQTRSRISEPIAIQKEIHEQRKRPVQPLLAELLTMIMKNLDMPISAAGFAAILALIAAKMEFSAFSHEEEDETR